MCISILVNAQLEASFVKGKKANSAHKNYKNYQNDTIRTLPFWDDFSYYTGIPDTTKWENSGGVIINQGLAIAPPSAGVASFDGLNRFGSPYDFNDNFPKGTADILTSLPIDLRNFAPSDNIYLSFFWQQTGLGEAPDPKQGDSLVVEFKQTNLVDSSISWNTVWSQIAIDSGQNDTITFVALAITDTFYFVEGFQFRIRNRGTLSGAYDNWHIDYVYLNSNRNADDRFFSDRTIIKEEGRIFKDYTSIPSRHIPNDSLYEFLKPSNSVSVRTLSNQFSNYDLELVFKDDLSQVILEQDTAVNETSIFEYLSRKREDYVVNQNVIISYPFDNRQSYNLSQTFVLRSNSDLVVPGYNAEINDTCIYQGQLDNFYAYDDGNAELGVGIRTPFGKVAVEYAPYKQDTITAIDIAFIPAEQSITGTEIGLRIWSSLERDVDPILYGQDVLGTYGSEINGFVRYNLDSALIVNDTFYLGWVQFDKTFLNVGWDMNNTFQNKVYTKVNPSIGWRNEEDFDYPGAMMIRPVFDSVGVPLVELNSPGGKSDDKKQTFEMKFHPNPAQGELVLDTDCDAFRITDLNGQEIMKGSRKLAGEKIDLFNIPNGVYISSFIFEGQRSIKRIIIQK